MGDYCRRARIPRHSAKVGEIMQVARLSPGDEAVLLGDHQEIACIPHAGCRLELVATAETSHPTIGLLLPGQVIRCKRSFFFGDRLELPGGTRVSLSQLVGFKVQLAADVSGAPPIEEAVVEQAARPAPRDVGPPSRVATTASSAR
jgi:hypothetical protein